MAHPVSNVIVEYFYWVFLALLALNLTQRRYREQGQRKRTAILYYAILVFAMYIYAYILIRLSLSDWLLLAYLAMAAVLIGVFRRAFLPFALRCRLCNRTLSASRLVFFDSSLCDTCDKKQNGDQAGEPSEQG